MKTKFLAVSLCFATLGLFAQKSELKTAEKALKKKDYAAALSAINSAEGLIANADAKTKSKFYFVKAQIFKGKNDYKSAAETFNKLMAFEKESGKATYTSKAQPMITEMVNDVATKGNKLYTEAKDYKAAAQNYYLVYLLSPQDTSFLYNAAISARQGEDYDASLKFLNELVDINYTGITTVYKATNKATNEVEDLGSKVNRDLMVKSGTYSNPKDEVTESKAGGILSSIAGVLIKLGKTEEAVAAIQKARSGNPSDLSLILAEADLYIKLKKMDEFAKLMKLAIEQSPNDPTLYFNLGVVNANQKNNKEAIEYYKKAIELKPDYADAYMNTAVVILSKEKAIVEEMNKNLSNFDKYDELAAKQKEVYKEALPYLQNADKYSRSESTVRTLLNLYETLEMEDKATEYRDIYKKMKG